MYRDVSKVSHLYQLFKNSLRLNSEQLGPSYGSDMDRKGRPLKSGKFTVRYSSKRVNFGEIQKKLTRVV